LQARAPARLAWVFVSATRVRSSEQKSAEQGNSRMQEALRQTNGNETNSRS
jgi:hypothetical protein